MDSIQLPFGNGKTWQLVFFKATHPQGLNLRADQWVFIYQLHNGKKLIDKGLFTGNHFISIAEQVLILEEFDMDTPSQQMNLRLFDLKNGKTGKFSRLMNGSFLLQRLEGNSFIFSKQVHGITSEFEVDLGQVTLVAMR